MVHQKQIKCKKLLDANLFIPSESDSTHIVLYVVICVTIYKYIVDVNLIYGKKINFFAAVENESYKIKTKQRTKKRKTKKKCIIHAVNSIVRVQYFEMRPEWNPLYKVFLSSCCAVNTSQMSLKSCLLTRSMLPALRTILQMVLNLLQLRS